MVLLLCVHVLRLLHLLRHDACGSHTQLPDCCNSHVIFSQLLESLLWFSNSQDGKTTHVIFLLLSIHLGLSGKKTHVVVVCHGVVLKLQLMLQLIPVWWRWYYWGSPVAWTIYGLVTSQLGDKTEKVLVPDHGDMPIKDYLKAVLGYDSDFLGYVALAHVGWALLFFVVFVYGIKVLNFQRRQLSKGFSASIVCKIHQMFFSFP